jgi:hypothetical protein
MKIEELLKNKHSLFLCWDEMNDAIDENGKPTVCNIKNTALISSVIQFQRFNNPEFYKDKDEETILCDFITTNWAYQDKSSERYEFVRRLNARQFADIFKENISTGTRFDDIIDREINKRKSKS